MPPKELDPDAAKTTFSSTTETVVRLSNDMEKCKPESLVSHELHTPMSTLRPDSDSDAPKPKSIPGPLSWTARALLIWLILENGADWSVPTSNFIMFPLPKGGNGRGAPPAGTQETAGALGYGLKTTNTIGTACAFLFPVISVASAWLADVTFTRLKVMTWGAVLGCLYLGIMLIASIPSVISSGHAAIPFLIGYIIQQVATAIAPVVIVPFILDQCSPACDYLSTSVSGETVLVKRQLTEEKVAYFTNGLGDIGGFLSIATTLFEKRVGYWLAWLPSFIIRLMLLVSILLLRPRIVRNKPERNGMFKIVSILRMLIRETGWRFLIYENAWEAAKPSRQGISSALRPKNGGMDWDDADVDGLRRFYHACKIFCIIPPYWLVGPNIRHLLPAQGSSMTTNGSPNDILGNLSSATTIIISYALPMWIYPFFRRRGIRIQPVILITSGCIIIVIAAVIGGFLQLHIYNTSPCGHYATGCTKGTGVSPISIWAQTPLYILAPVSNILVISSACGLACHFTPTNMMSVSISAMVSVYIFRDAAGLGLAQAVTDPYLVWIWFGPAIVMSVLTAVFYWSFRRFDKELSESIHLG